MLKTLLLASGLAAFASIGAANAGVYTINVWNGTPDGTTSSAAADLPTPSGIATASFTYTGDINFQITSNDNTKNTMANFFDIGGLNPPGTITNFSSSDSLSTFGGLTMSTSGDGIVSYIQILGSYFGAPGTTGSIRHDDGASFYSSGSGSVSCGSAMADYCSPGLTTAKSGTFTMSGSGQTPFDLVYVEANGDPSILQFSVPEPTSIALFGVGLLGMGIISRRKNQSAV